MIRFSLVFALLGLQQLAWASLSRASWIESPLLTTSYVESYGLRRAWHTQIFIDGERHKIKHIRLEADLLLVTTNDGWLHVIDANTGIVNWKALVGERRFVTLAAGANEKFVAAANGDSLYIYDRDTGKVAYRHRIRGTAELGPALTENRTLVPIVNGPLESYPLDANPEVDILGPQQLPAAGRMVNEPATFAKSVVWGGDRDRLFGQQFGEKPSKFETYVRFGVNSGPVSLPPMVYVGTKAGFLVAYNQDRGLRVWEFPAGSPIFHPPVALADVVYALPQDGGMFAVKADTGQQLWYAAEPLRFAAASPQLIYTFDYRNRLAIIDAKTGARAAVMPMPEGMKAVINQDSDRMYLYTDSGLIQCVHERQLVEPHRYLPTPPSATPAEGGASPFTEPAATTEPATTTPPAEAGSNPFGDPAPMPGGATP